MATIRTTPSVPSAAELALQLEAEGFRAGAPPHVPAEWLAIDRRECRRMRCPACRQRMHPLPFHNPISGCYRMLVVCRHCGAAQEA